MSNNPALLCGIEPNDGLLVAYLPKLEGIMQEHECQYGTLYSFDGVAIDILPGPVKWWKVRESRAAFGLAPVEPLWQGPAADFVLDSFLDRLQFLPKPEGHRLHMRAYSRGPWICLEMEPGSKDELLWNELTKGTDASH